MVSLSWRDWRAALSPKGRGEKGEIWYVRAMSIYDSIRAQIVPITPEGYPFIGAFAFASLVLFWLWSPLGWLGTLATIWCAYFFRDPPRVTPVRDGLVVAPADGRISQVTSATPPPELGLGHKPPARMRGFTTAFGL